MKLAIVLSLIVSMSLSTGGKAIVDSRPLETIPETDKLKTVSYTKADIKPLLDPPTQAVEPIVPTDWVEQCKAWASAADVPLNEAAIQLLDRESKCDPHAQNPTSTAYGIGQFLDTTWQGTGCVKGSDPIYQLKCMYKYVNNRYGSWEAALAHSLADNWY